VVSLIDLVFLAVVWEYFGKPTFNLKLWLRAFLTLLGVMWLDVILFSTGAFFGTPVYTSVMKGTLVSRLIVSIFAFPFLYGYLQWQSSKKGVEIGSRPVLAILKQVAEIKLELSFAQREIEMRKKAEQERDRVIVALKKNHFLRLKPCAVFCRFVPYVKRSGMIKAIGIKSKRILRNIPMRCLVTAFARNAPKSNIHF
jgi:hypothetical protein